MNKSVWRVFPLAQGVLRPWKDITREEWLSIGADPRFIDQPHFGLSEDAALTLLAEAEWVWRREAEVVFEAHPSAKK